ncbi:hypothetical protein [Blastopirellula retiformator]|uniref:Uncharacterized protein n=1 Tax=Blastopirellula retiformator TaxID=2527970 RepID=A0A5C5VMW6_9BACT|nr:hypothetical protein [Blastopirellula retiformator]TWT39052.1 hypothetical protein Enr8_07470 [Blastopirellula retiformator]
MTLVEPPPNLPEEERDTAEQLNRKAGRLERFRFSMTRLIVATALAPLPYWMIPTKSESAKIALAVSSLAVAGVVLSVRARHLPRINLTLQIGALVLICSSCCLPWFMDPIFFCVGTACSAVVAFLATEAIYPSRVVHGRPPMPLRARSVLLTGATPFVLVCLALLSVNTATPYGAPDRRLLLPALWGAVLSMAALFVWNIAGWYFDEGATLDERPDLGYRYEATTVLIPVALIVAILRVFSRGIS